MTMAARPVVHLYAICWNDAAMLGFFFRHYDPWVDRYVFFDDGSTDGTLDLLRRHPRAEIARFPRLQADSFVVSASLLQNVVWKASRGQADWVVITAIDEHLYHPDLPAWLAACGLAGVTMLPALGYQMVADTFPPADSLLCRSLTRGAPYGMMSKLSLFRPHALTDTGFSVGRHFARPTGELVLPERDELVLLHYKYLGRDYTRARHAMLAAGLGAFDREQGWGSQYSAGDAAFAAEFDGFAARAVDIAAPHYDAARDHPDPRWWRQSLPSARFVPVPPGA
jgi:hypothetical protein